MFGNNQRTLRCRSELKTGELKESPEIMPPYFKWIQYLYENFTIATGLLDFQRSHCKYNSVFISGVSYKKGNDKILITCLCTL